MELHERIRQRREALGMTQEELARRMGYRSRSSINKIETGQNDIPQSKMDRFAQALDTSVAELLGISPDTGKPPKTAADFDVFAIPNILPLPKMVPRPLIGTIACGTPITAVQNVTDHVMVPEDVRCDFVLRCKGDSMTGAMIMDGSLVYIREQPDVENGTIAAVMIDDEATLKRVYKTDTSITLLPENNKYPPLVYTNEAMNQVRILGAVVAWLNFL